MKNITNNKISDLFRTILALNNQSEARKFFRDLLTEKEITEFAERWRAAQMLYQNTSYTKIQKKTGLSSRTIARISSWLNKGKGGYLLMITRKHHNTYSTAGKGL